MKRYVLFDTCPPVICPECPPGHCGGLGPTMHWFSLPESGSIMVVYDNAPIAPHVPWPPSGARELPHLLDQTAANFNGINATPGAYVHPSGALTPAPEAIGGIAVTDTTFQVVRKIAKINSLFDP